MAVESDGKEVISFEEPSPVFQQEALNRLLMEKGYSPERNFLEIVRVVDREMKGKKKVAV